MSLIILKDASTSEWEGNLQLIKKCLKDLGSTLLKLTYFREMLLHFIG